jgi:hypothetical protein
MVFTAVFLGGIEGAGAGGDQRNDILGGEYAPQVIDRG